MHRRRFLAAAAASTTPLPHLSAHPHEEVLGHGDFRYRIDREWSKADPTTTPVNDCHEMVQAPDGRLFLLTNHPDNNVLIYATGGELLGHWTLGFRGAHGLSIHGEHLYITDTSSKKVVKTDLQGNVLLTLPHAHDCGAYRKSQPYVPTETAIAPNGDIYVADGYGSQYFLHFDPSGTFVRKFGGKSTQPVARGKFIQAHGIALDDRGAGDPLLVCTARIRNEFTWFTLEGEFVRSIYLPGVYMSRPVIAGKHLYSAVCFGTFPHDYRMWQGRGFVTILDENGRMVSNPGGTQPRYEHDTLTQTLPLGNHFHNPHDVCVDTSGDLYICQWNSNKVYPYKLHRI